MKKALPLLCSLFILLTCILIVSCSKDKITNPDPEVPYPPTNPNPPTQATDVPIYADLSWDCHNPNIYSLLYDVYFGTNPNPPIVSNNQISTIYDPGTLNEGTTYYWKIIVYDGAQNNSTIGDIWEFTTTTTEFEWCTVPAGQFTYGMQDEILYINYDYQIMKYEVTNQQYLNYLEEAYNTGNISVSSSTVEGYYEGDEIYSAGNYEFYDLDDGDNRIHWNGSNFIIETGYEEHPVVEVTWFGAWAFAENYGLSLPTEHEWEKSARGNTAYDFPWGNSIDGSRANYNNSGDPWDNGTTPVGMYNGQIIQGFQTTDSPSPYDVYDMAGNVWEWTYGWSIYLPPRRVIRGGSWENPTGTLRSWRSGSLESIECYECLGFRCVVR